MVKATLHYFYDPFCGWCYAASPLLQAVSAQPELVVQLHGGGMMSGTNRQAVTPALRDYVIPHDMKIAKLTGLAFGQPYFEQLLRDGTALFDSTPPTAAILAAESLGASPLVFLSALQRAHYQQGWKIAEQDVLLELAVQQGMDRSLFAAALDTQSLTVDAHIAASRHQMQQAGLRGFPSLLLEQDGRWQRVEISTWLGQPQAFVSALSHLADEPAITEPLFCTPESCKPVG